MRKQDVFNQTFVKEMKAKMNFLGTRCGIS